MADSGPGSQVSQSILEFFLSLMIQLPDMTGERGGRVQVRTNQAGEGYRELQFAPDSGSKLWIHTHQVRTNQAGEGYRELRKGVPHPQHDQMVPINADGCWCPRQLLQPAGLHIQRISIDFRLKNEECYDLLTAKDPQVLEQVYTTMKPGANTLDFPHAIYIDGIDVGGGLHTGAISIEESGFPIEESGFPIKES